MLKFILVIIFFFLSQTYFWAQKKPFAFDKHFPEISFDTLHVHIDLKHQHTKIEIPDKLIKKDAETEHYPAVSFFIDKKRRFKAYLLLSGRKKSSSKSEVHLIVIKVQNGELIYSNKIAGYEKFEGTYEKWQNAWIADFNKDGSLDIGVYEKLIDFELPTEESENISGDEKYLLIFKNGLFQHRKWNYNILKHYRIKP